MNNSVKCLLCSHSAVTLARHLKAVHGVTAESYRAQFPEARIRSEACEANRKASTVKAHAENPRKGLKKKVTCPCGSAHEVGLTFASSDFRCPSCKQRDADAIWASKVEGHDFVVCLECGHRAENLTSHMTHVHPDRIGSYAGPMVADNSAVRDKSSLKGRSPSEETRAKMAASAGWNRGLTKETDERVARASTAMKGREAWSKGLTKADHPSLQRTSEKLSVWKGELRYWSNGLKASLSEFDFTPFLDETGAVDRKSMAEALGLSEPTVTKYMDAIGLRLSTKYVDDRVERQMIRIEKEDLLPFLLHNGKLVVARAMVGLGRDYTVVKREAERHGIPLYTQLVRQTICLDAVSRALGMSPYEQEWRSRKFMSAAKAFFRFDGYFPDHDLVVEFHGYQHWTFPSVFIKKEELFFQLQERDRIKENLVRQDPMLKYFVVREDEPYSDSEYLRERLIAEGIVERGYDLPE